MRIILVRHTKTECQAGICYGQTDVLPNSFFNEDKKKIIENLLKYEYSTIYTSPLKRCFMLAKSIAANKKIIVDERLKELNFGDWELKHWDEISKTDYAKQWFEDYINIPCPNGESFVELIDRVKSFIMDLRQTKADNVLIVTHSGIIRAFYILIEKYTAEKSFEVKLGFASISVLDLD